MNPQSLQIYLGEAARCSPFSSTVQTLEEMPSVPGDLTLSLCLLRHQ